MLRRDCRRRRRQTPRCDCKACRHPRKEEVLHLIQLLYCSDCLFEIRHPVRILSFKRDAAARPRSTDDDMPNTRTEQQSPG